jgi:hypothetical protein
MPKILETYAYAISYSPLIDEPDPLKHISSNEIPVIYAVAPSYATLPSEIARELKKSAGENNICIYIPGRAFDARGVRHGRGKGWYDRLLSELPQKWLRIGFCFKNQFSDSPLTKQLWDQTMDWVCVTDRDGVCWYETKARTQS